MTTIDDAVDEVRDRAVDFLNSEGRSTTHVATGIAITAGFAFDVPVRFDTDALDVTLDLERLGSITSIPLLEIRR